MNDGTKAGGAPARVDPADFANTADHLRTTWEQLTQLANLHAREVMRFSADPERFTAQEVVHAWHEANTKVSEAMNHLAFVTETLRSQRAGIIAALKTAADSEENHT